jgi:hypothetical protein
LIIGIFLILVSARKAKHQKEELILKYNRYRDDALSKHQAIAKNIQNITLKNKQIEQQNAPVYKQRYQIWERLYYCFQDDIAYLPNDKLSARTVDEIYHILGLDIQTYMKYPQDIPTVQELLKLSVK